MDTMRVRGITCQVHLGVPEAERASPQSVEVDLELNLDLEAAANTDNLILSVDYDQLARKVQAAAAEGEYRLVESLASRLCQVVLADSKVEQVSVTVRKFPRALEGIIQCVEVTLLRR